MNAGLAGAVNVLCDGESDPDHTRSRGPRRGAAADAPGQARARRRRSGADRGARRGRRARLLGSHRDGRGARHRRACREQRELTVERELAVDGVKRSVQARSTPVHEAACAPVFGARCRVVHRHADDDDGVTRARRLRRIVTGQLAPAVDMSFATVRWRALGTTAVLCTSTVHVMAARRAVEAELEAIDEAASRFRAESELSRLSRARGAWTAVSPLLLEALELAVRAAVLTDGAVDPTLGHSLRELGYDRDYELLARAPATRPLQSAEDARPTRGRALWSGIELRDDPPSARLPAGVALDLGATAKALAADRAAAAAHAVSGAGVLVSLGGDVATAGRCPTGGWPVRVTDDHRSDLSADGQTITIRDGGLATSSLLTRRWEHDGRVLHHVLDPVTGQPVRPCWRTVSVAAGTCADANIASTAAIVLAERAPAWLDAQELPARLVAAGGDVALLGGWPS